MKPGDSRASLGEYDTLTNYEDGDHLLIAGGILINF